MARALIVDGYELFRITLRDLVAASGRFNDIDEASSSGAFIRAATEQDDIALMVIHPRSIGLSDSDCLRLAARLLPDARLVLFRDKTAAEDDAFETPNVTVLPRQAHADDVRAALDTQGADCGHENAPFESWLPNPPHRTPAEMLSRRQRQIMAMVAEGLANKEIAHRLGIAEGTVKAHIHAVFKALGVSNRTQAVVRYGPQLRAASL